MFFDKFSTFVRFSPDLCTSNPNIGAADQDNSEKAMASRSRMYSCCIVADNV
jgi:hypothetical protein